MKLAKMFNVDKTTVLNYVKRHNLERRNTLDKIVDIEVVKEYIRKNRPTVKDVSDKYNISRCSIYNIIKRADDDSLVLNSYNPRISNAVVNAKEICDKYNVGYNIQDLIKIFHTTKKYISRVLKENGIKIQRGRKALL